MSRQAVCEYRGLAGAEVKDLGEWAKGVMEEVYAVLKNPLALLASHGFAKAMQEHILPRATLLPPAILRDNVFFFRDPSRVPGSDVMNLPETKAYVTVRAASWKHEGRWASNLLEAVYQMC
jgi:hypothetical protein